MKGKIVRFRTGKRGDLVAFSPEGKVILPFKGSEWCLMPGEPYVVLRATEKPRVILVDVTSPDDLEGLLEAGVTPIEKKSLLESDNPVLYKGAWYKIVNWGDSVSIYKSDYIEWKVRDERGVSYQEKIDVNGKVLGRSWPSVWSVYLARKYFPVVREEPAAYDPTALRLEPHEVRGRVFFDLSSIDPDWGEVSGTEELVLPPNSGEFALVEWRASSEQEEVTAGYAGEEWGTGRMVTIHKFPTRIRHLPTGEEVEVDLYVHPLTVPWGEWPQS